MALPQGITPKTVTFGPAVYFDGTVAEGTVTISAPENVINTATNSPLYSSQMSQRLVDGMASFSLCPTDAEGLNIKSWTYKLNVTIQGALKQDDARWFPLPEAGPDTIDLDGLVTVPSSAGIPISVDVLTADELDPLTAGYIGDTDSATAVALRAALDAWLDPDGLPTLEELERASPLGTISATGVIRLGPVNLDQRIGSLTLATSAAVAASDANYWTVALQRLRASQNPLTIATKTTKATGGEAFTADQGWNFDAMQWLETARHLRKGDVLALSFTKTGTPANLADVTAAVRYEPGVRPIIRDTFTRADSTTSLGSTDTGQAWNQLTGTWGIDNGRAYISASTVYAFATFDSGVSDCTVSARLAAAGASFGLVFRATDKDNLWAWEASGLWKYEAGGFTQVIPYAGGWASGDTATAVLSGTTLTVYRNGALIGTTTDAFNQTATEVGLWIAPNDGVTRWDDLAIAI